VDDNDEGRVIPKSADSTLRLASEVRGAGPRLVFVHGFTQTGRSWSTVADTFVDTHEVVTVDAPGHGDSAALRCDLDGGALALGATGQRAAYVGYSMGGRLALHLALVRPELVTRLVLLGATAGIESATDRLARREADEQLAVGLERDGVDAFLERWLNSPLFAGLPHDQTALDDRRRNTVAGLASSLRFAGTGTQQPLWNRLDELEMPVLILAGEHDEKFRAIGQRMTAAIGANAQFSGVPNAGHAAHLEQPNAFTRLVADFIC
jgi:2-succinyl-6-hydroxy-2,4-cyclohexadiene-1-carboxylate synthase